MVKLLEVRGLTKIFTTGFFRKTSIVAVDNVSFELPIGKPMIFTIAGESGSGKTTIARLILGFIKPTSGSIHYRGKNIWSMSNKEWRNYRRRVQAVFQDPYSSFNPLRKVDSILWTPIKKFRLARNYHEASNLIKESLEAVGLRPEEVLGKYPHQLSGGQRQRLMLARAFLIRPELIIADEPVSMIDASSRANILNLMLKIKKDLGTSFIYITHDLSTAHYISDSIMILYRGSIVEIGDISKVVSNPLHPYVRILLDSIPIPDPLKRWKESIILPEIEIEKSSYGNKGCKFFKRCPIRDDSCASITPKLVKVERGHWVACLKAIDL